MEATEPCRLCGSREHAELYPAGVAQVHRIVRCAGCGLMYANPQGAVDIEDIRTWPDDPAFDVEARFPQRLEKERAQLRDHAWTVERLCALHPGGGRLVEVGSSTGFLLQALRERGWDVLGVEPDPNLVNYSTRKLGLPVRRGTLEQAALPSASVDAVIMLHVIEHVPDPLATLREIWRVLKPGGHLVLETPRYDTLAFRVLGRRERSLSCDGHVYFFTLESLARACRLGGLEPVEVVIPGRTLTLDRLVYNLGVISKSRRLQGWLGAASRRLGLQRVSATLSLRDMQRVLARKAEAGQPAAT